MKELLATVACCLTMCLTAHSQTTIRHVRLNSPVDTNTIAVAYNLISNAVAVASRLGILDQESLARAIQVGQDLNLIQTSTNGWVVAVDNIVEVDQAHVPGVLFVGDTIYGAPSSEKGRIDLTGCDFYYDRQIPGDGTGTNGWGNIVTDPYMDWRLSGFYSQFWESVAAASDLPASIAADLQAYSSATGGIQQSISQAGAILNEINATNAVIQSVIENAISQAGSSGGGQSWTTSTTSGTSISCADYCIHVCTYSGGDGVTITMPTSTGSAHSIVFFPNASDLYSNGSYISYSHSGDRYTDDDYNGGCSFYKCTYLYDDSSGMSFYCYSYPSCLMIDIRECGAGNWVTRWIPLYQGW